MQQLAAVLRLSGPDRSTFSLRSSASIRWMVVGCFLAVLAAVHGLAQSAVPVSVVSAAGAYGKLPLIFEANQGQSDAAVRFLSRGEGYSLFLTDAGAVLSLSKDRAGKKGDVVRMGLVGAAKGAQVNGAERLRGTANYFIGNDATKWHADVPTYARVKYSQVYPGVDLVYYGNQRQLEYDFVVAPHADAKQVRLRFAGAERLRLAAKGDLRIIAAHGEIAFHTPVVYQVRDGRKEAVAGRFELVAKNEVGFVLGKYDAGRELVIDPTLTYSTYLGGTTEDYATAVTADASGDTYVTGVATSTNFPVTSGAFQTTNKEQSTSRSNAFVTKINAAGTALVYSTYLGGTADGCSNNTNTLTQGDYGSAIAVDASGDAYITGSACQNDFPVTKGAFQTTFSTDAASNAFVTKLNATGSALVYSTYLGGSGDFYSGDFGNGIAVDASGDAYVTGQTSSGNFPVSKGAYQTTRPNSAGRNSAFVTKMNATGTALVYSTYLGGSGSAGSSPGDSGQGIKINASGNAYVTGYTYSKDFPVSSSAYQKTNKAFVNGGSNAFVTEMNTTGTALVFSTYLGGSAAPEAEQDGASGIALDSAGNVYIAGGTHSTDFPVSSAAYKKTFPAGSGEGTGFISKLNATGSALTYSTFLGGSGEEPCGGDRINGLALDSEDEALVTGFACSDNFPVTTGAYQTTNKGTAKTASNAFLTQLNAAGSALVYSTYFGGTGSSTADSGDVGNAVAYLNGSVYFAGATTSTNFPVSGTAYQKTNKATAGDTTAFVVKFAFATASTTTLVTDGTPEKVGTKVTFTADVTGAAGSGTPTGTVDFSVDGGTAVAETLDDTGHAAYATTTLAEGMHKVVASYLGDATHLASTSAALSETIYGAASTETEVSGAGQTVPVGATSAPLVVIVKDAKGDVVPGVVVTFSGTDLKFSSTTATTGANGEASVTASPTAAGSLTVKATAAGVSAAVTFTITATSGVVAEPTVTQVITIAEATSGATVYYTTNGSTPTTASTKYTGPITLTGSETLKFIAVKAGFTSSAVRTVTDTVQ